MKSKKTFPSWVSYSGLEISSQRFPDILSGSYGSQERDFKEISALYRTNLIGFHNPVIQESLDSGLYSSVPFGMTNPLIEQFGEKILEITDMQGGTVIPSCSGSVAVDHVIMEAW